MRKLFLKMPKILMLTIMIIGSQQVIASNNPDLQTMLDGVLASQDAESGSVTGIPLTFQCNGVNNNQPITIASGKLSNEPNSQNLPIDAIYQIGSDSKSFTAVVALQLEYEGLFGIKGLDSTVGEMLGNDVYPKWKDLKLRQLLNMTSGIPEYDNVEIIAQTYADDPTHFFDTDDLLKSVANNKLDFTPGTNYKYSNTGYVLMNKIITQRSGISYKQQVTDRIISKLGLTNTYYIEDIPENAIPDEKKWQTSLLMSGYYIEGPDTITYHTKYLYPGVDIKTYSLSITNAPGAIISNSADLNTYLRALFTVDAPNALLTKPELEELTTFVAQSDSSKYKAGQIINGDVDKDTPMAYGLGISEAYFELPSGQGIVMYAHEGGTYGFYSMWEYQKNGDVSFTYSTNSNSILSAKTIFNIHTQLLDTITNYCSIK
ncbi:MAG: D-alanyl-D-alanine carboxypeptidase [Pseudomonadota bacterium]|nr:D-alanyl-D-alanine carboxypeptidase [Pseudomonadota bacterium]